MKDLSLVVAEKLGVQPQGEDFTEEVASLEIDLGILAAKLGGFLHRHGEVGEAALAAVGLDPAGLAEPMRGMVSDELARLAATKAEVVDWSALKVA